MSTVLNANPSGRHSLAAPRLGASSWRRIALGALLVAEILLCSIRFDTKSIEDVDLPLADALGQVSLVARFAVSVVAAVVVFCGCGLANSWRQIAGEAGGGAHRVWPPLAAHALGAAAFYALTAALLERGMIQSAAAPAWTAAWAAAAAVALAGWALALYPLRVWRSALARVRGLLAIGIVLGVGAVAAGAVADYFWPLLSGPTLDAVAGMLRLVYDDVFVHDEEMLVRVQDFTVMVGPECSGFEGVGLVGLFLGAFLWSLRGRLLFPQSLVILPVGMALIWVANVLRLAALIVIGASVSPEVARGGFHSQAGWLAFNAVALGIVYVVWNSSFFRAAATRDGRADGARYEYAAAPYLAPLLILVAILMVTTAMSAAGFDWFYPVRAVATLGVVAWYWPTYRARGEMAWSWSFMPLAIGAAVFALWMLLEPLAGVDGDATVEQSRALATVTPLAAGLWILFRALGSIVAVPFAEELAFRGYLTRRFIDDDFDQVPLGQFTWFSFLASSILFGLLHGRWLAGTLAGGLFALALYRRGRLMDAVVAHATANALVTTYVLATGDWAAWS